MTTEQPETGERATVGVLILRLGPDGKLVPSGGGGSGPAAEMLRRLATSLAGHDPETARRWMADGPQAMRFLVEQVAHMMSAPDDATVSLISDAYQNARRLLEEMP